VSSELARELLGEGPPAVEGAGDEATARLPPLADDALLFRFAADAGRERGARGAPGFFAAAAAAAGVAAAPPPVAPAAATAAEQRAS
jgi:hypothetical protein